MTQEIEYTEVQKVLQKLLNRLESIADEHEELYEIEAKIALSQAIIEVFILAKEGSKIPESFGLESVDANAEIEEALTEYIDAMIPLVKQFSLDSDEKRKEAFQDLDVETNEDQDVEDFFDWIEDLDDFRKTLNGL